ncbi:MAG: hypothetical protein AAF413_02475 [Patescibacteria group bacterium]
MLFERLAPNRPKAPKYGQPNTIANKNDLVHAGVDMLYLRNEIAQKERLGMRIRAYGYDLHRDLSYIADTLDQHGGGETEIEKAFIDHVALQYSEILVRIHADYANRSVVERSREYVTRHRWASLSGAAAVGAAGILVLKGSENAAELLVGGVLFNPAVVAVKHLVDTGIDKVRDDGIRLLKPLSKKKAQQVNNPNVECQKARRITRYRLDLDTELLELRKRLALTTVEHPVSKTQLDELVEHFVSAMHAHFGLRYIPKEVTEEDKEIIDIVTDRLDPDRVADIAEKAVKRLIAR